MLSYSVWAFGMVVSLAASGASLRWDGVVVTFLSVIASTIFWLLFDIAYTGRRDWLTRPRLFALGAGYLGYAVLLLTNPRHNLLFADPDLLAADAIVALEESFTPGLWANTGGHLAVRGLWLTVALPPEFPLAQRLSKERLPGGD